MKYNTKTVETKECRRCKVSKPTTKFYADNRNKDGKRSYCKECDKKQRKKYMKDKEFQARTKEYFKKWHIDNPNYRKELYRKNRERELETSRMWYLENKNTPEYRERKRREVSRWRQRLNSTTYDYDDNDWIEALNFFNKKCCYCGAETELERDHFIPLSKGGPFIKENIVPACRSCNASKQDKLFEEWYFEQDYYDKEREKKVYDYLGISGKIQQLSIL